MMLKKIIVNFKILPIILQIIFLLLEYAWQEWKKKVVSRYDKNSNIFLKPKHIYEIFLKKLIYLLVKKLDTFIFFFLL